MPSLIKTVDSQILDIDTPNPDIAEEKAKKNKNLYSYSIYGNLHCMDFGDFTWSVISENIAENVK